MQAFLTRKWSKEQGYRLKKHLWAFEVCVCVCAYIIDVARLLFSCSPFFPSPSFFPLVCSLLSVCLSLGW